MIALYGVIGFALALASLVLSFAYPYHHLIQLFLLGFWLFIDSIDLKLTKYSLLYSTVKKPVKGLLCITAIGVIIGAIIEFLGITVLNMWKYFVFPMNFWILNSGTMLVQSFGPLEFVNLMIGWILLTAIFYETYRVLHKLLSKKLKYKTKRLKKSNTRIVFASAGAAGIILLAVPIILHSMCGNRVPFDYILYALGLWLAIEFIAHLLGRESLLEQALKGNLTPMASAALAVYPIILTDILNIPIKAWAYNSLVMGYAVLGIPLILLAFCPISGLALFSLYNLLCRDKKIWSQ